MEGWQLGWGSGRMGGKVRGLRSKNWSVQNRQEDVKNSMGHGVTKELIRMTHGHELSGGILLGGGAKGEIGTTVIA